MGDRRRISENVAAAMSYAYRPPRTIDAKPDKDPEGARKTVIESMKSHAVVVYTGKDRSPFPVEDIGAVRSLDVPEAEDLARYVQTVAGELNTLFPLDWAERNNVEPDRAVRLIESAMGARHPELSVEAVAALAWTWSYCAWK